MGLKGMRVLLVEDEALVAMLIEDYLDALGCELVGVASRLDEALAKARAPDIDLAVVDVNLAGAMSYPVARALRARGVPLVFTTGYGRVGVPEELRAAPVLAKPFQQEQLGQAMREARVAGGPEP
ncbi:MAG: response regulator [Acetobacteraceae bacterium]|nr:response regulator [Acetobacteraceae bacterium]